MTMAIIKVQTALFDPGAELNQLHQHDCGVGAVASFVGYVRNHNAGDSVQGFFLEHAPGLTENALQRIVAQAKARWPLHYVRVLHRVGTLSVGEPIVFVGVASTHRAAAFSACAFIMDLLKTQAPFWKKELTPAGERWVEGRASDELAAQRWDSYIPPKVT